MSDKDSPLTDRLGKLRQANAKAAEDEADEDFPCYGCVRGNRRAFNIELRRLRGSWPAPEYAWLHFAEWWPVETKMGNVLVRAGSIVLHYESGQVVVISGRNLRTIHQRILEHQVKYVAEVNHSTDTLAEEKDIIVTRIELFENRELLV